MTTKNNDLTALRDVLFDTLRGLKDGTVTIEQASAINATGQTIINSAKVEVDFLKLTDGGTGTGFIPVDLSGHPTPTGTVTVAGGVTRHRMR